ncbi:MAG: hypothetical protein KatS3mg108_0127 [Isosphaeraceae bacterium]|nr:MAG: hypothetical protein KatS3mg108_0127 [Isosphaeraceae bacterium]
MLRFFCERLRQLSPDKLESVHLAIVDRFSLVSITCDEQDNPHLIFESLNAKGAKLTPADLIRNFLFMRVHVGDQERLFRTHWLPIQQALEDHLTEFVRHFLMKDGKILRESEVYFELKDRLAGSTPADVEAFLRVLHHHGMYYARFVDPRRESDRDLAERLDRICRLKVTVAYPFLLRVFDAYESQQLTKQQVVETLKIVESFVIRRAVCGRPTNQLRRIFPPVFDAAGGPGPTFVDGLRRQLGGARCPDDAEFKQALTTVPLYANSEKNIRLRLMLECLERSYGHREPADLSQTTIEHVLPQKLTEQWRVELGDDAETVWNRLVDTLGNLTLSAYNPELSNQPYSVKRRLLIESHLDLNQYFQNVDTWDERAILLRSEKLADRALQIWPDVGRSPGSSGRDSPATKPLAVQFRGRRLPCRNWRDGFQKLVEMFEQDQPGLLERLAGEDAFSAIVSFEPARFPRSKFQLGNVFVNTHASAAVLRDWCRRLAERAGLQPSDYGFITPDRNERLSTSS